jgi:hypothetical protein
MAPGEPAEERHSFADVVLPGRLRETVPIYYESRIAKLSLNAAELPKLELVVAGDDLVDRRAVAAADRRGRPPRAVLSCAP